MKLLRFFLIIFISLTSPVKADLNKKLINQLEDGGKLIFIRHAYAPGSGDPDNFNLNDCSTQRNLSKEGQRQAEYIGEFFRNNNRRDVVGVFKIASDFNNDIGVVSIDDPVDGTLSDSENITVTLFNYGQQDVSNFDLSYQVDNNNTQMLEAYDAIQEGVVFLKTDMLSLLSISVDYMDADGD